MKIDGWTAERFGRVADAFAGAVPEDGRGGAAVALYLDGEPVVDLWGGTADTRTGRAWGEDTVGQVFSCAKGLVSLLVHLLAQEGRVDLDAPVARYWPGFEANGKAGVTLRHVLTHQAGLPVLEARLDFDEVLAWDPVVAALAGQAPLWEPGTAHAYHGFTFGWLLGEVIRRVTGRTVGEYFRERLGAPPPDFVRGHPTVPPGSQPAAAIHLASPGLDTWIGLPSAQFPRLARLEGPDRPIQLPGPDHLFTRTLTVNGAIDFPGVDSPNGWNAPALTAAEMPGTNAVSSARGLAALFAAAATGIGGDAPLLSRDTLTAALRERTSGPCWPDNVLPFARWGTGFMLDSPPLWTALGPRSFGCDGAGGTTAFGDDDHGVGFAFLSNRIIGADDRRAERLLAAVRDCLGRPAR